MQLQSRLSELTAGECRVLAQDSKEFAAAIDDLINLIEDKILEQEPEVAFKYLDQVLKSTEAILARVEDPDDYVKTTLKEAVITWLAFAKKLNDTKIEVDQPWEDLVLEYFENNNSGIFSGIIANSSELLTHTQLKELASTFELRLRQLINFSNHEAQDVELLKAASGLGEAADALNDMALFEKSIMIHSPQPTALQMEQLVIFAIEKLHFERAEYWLSQEWNGYHVKKVLLKVELLRFQSRHDEIISYLVEEFAENPEVELLESILFHVEPTTDDAVIQSLQMTMSSLADKTLAIDMAVKIQNMELANSLVITHLTRIKPILSEQVNFWLENLTEPLARCLCYRVLIMESLALNTQMESQRALEYLLELENLDRLGVNYGKHPIHAEFINDLRSRFPGSTSFWFQVDYLH